jgi:hypothetical protein
MTDDKLDELERLFQPVRDCWAECLKPGQSSNRDRLIGFLMSNLQAFIDELRETRSLLATPMPCDRQVEHLKVTADPDGWLNVPGIGCWRPDVMLAFAAQIIRTALQAKEGSK